MGPRQQKPDQYAKQGVFQRAWGGLVDFYQQFTQGPGYPKRGSAPASRYEKLRFSERVKQVRTQAGRKSLKKKLPKRAKLVNIKAEAKELKQEQVLLKQPRPVEV